MATRFEPNQLDTSRPAPSLRIDHATIVTQDDSRRVMKDHALYVDDGRIAELAPHIATEADHVIDATGHVVLPGLINTHTHFPMTLFRGYGDDMLLEAWLQERIWPAEARLTEATMAAGGDLGLLEMIGSGTTSFLDMYFMEGMLAERTAKAGMRGWMGTGMVDIGQTPEGEAHARIPEIAKMIDDYAGHELITPCAAPHATYTCNPETLSKSAELAARTDTPLHIHCSETRTEVYDVEKRFGKRPVQHIADTGALIEQTVLAHCGWITKAEVQDIAQAQAKVAHNPTSNLKLATGGVTPLPELFAAGVTVGLGTDGPASNNVSSLFEAMKTAAIIQKQARWDALVVPAQQALDMATRGGAATLRREQDLGSIERGKIADLAIMDFRRPHLVPCHDVVSNIVYAGQMQDVTHTIVGGRVLYANGVFTTLDRDAVIAAAEAAAAEVCQTGQAKVAA